MAALLALFVVAFAMVFGNSAADPDLLQDICVADLTAGTLLLLQPSSLFQIFQYYSAKSEHQKPWKKD